METTLYSFPGSRATGHALQTDRCCERQQHKPDWYRNRYASDVQNTKTHASCMQGVFKICQGSFRCLHCPLEKKNSYRKPALLQVQQSKGIGLQLLSFVWHLTSGAWTEIHSDQMPKNNCYDSTNNNCPPSSVNTSPACLMPLSHSMFSTLVHLLHELSAAAVYRQPRTASDQSVTVVSSCCHSLAIICGSEALQPEAPVPLTHFCHYKIWRGLSESTQSAHICFQWGVGRSQPFFHEMEPLSVTHRVWRTLYHFPAGMQIIKLYRCSTSPNWRPLH